MQIIKAVIPGSLKKSLLIGLVPLLLAGGCLPITSGETLPREEAMPATGGESVMISAEPYYTQDFKDILIPSELEWRRDRSVSINTASFTGGILFFSGRVEVNSLTEFFINSMQQNGWQVTGTVKSKDVLLSYIKESGTCMMRIFEGGTLGKTDVFIYVTHTGN
ncbi:MAG: hypothetical protein KJ950_09085 [Proteobacteria bacterium]|nr:hypothetical protein [Pseudomonadota bacterium]MBU1686648.1 hypothetical protein [Pseudomonadota bacterium]